MADYSSAGLPDYAASTPTEGTDLSSQISAAAPTMQPIPSLPPLQPPSIPNVPSPPEPQPSSPAAASGECQCPAGTVISYKIFGFRKCIAWNGGVSDCGSSGGVGSGPNPWAQLTFSDKLRHGGFVVFAALLVVVGLWAILSPGRAVAVIEKARRAAA